ncbi:hypothetical protein Tco_1288268, partial [Tanacetum coccineum]
MKCLLLNHSLSGDQMDECYYASVEKGYNCLASITEDGAYQHGNLALVEVNIVCSKKDLWEKIKLLMQGTSLTKQERECKLYDEFDKFAYKKGETLHEYYLRFTLLLNDMNIYKMVIGAVSRVNSK